jgi:hypothetical protein
MAHRIAAALAGIVFGLAACGGGSRPVTTAAPEERDPAPVLRDTPPTTRDDPAQSSGGGAPLPSGASGGRAVDAG